MFFYFEHFLFFSQNFALELSILLQIFVRKNVRTKKSVNDLNQSRSEIKHEPKHAFDQKKLLLGFLTTLQDIFRPDRITVSLTDFIRKKLIVLFKLIGFSYKYHNGSYLQYMLYMLVVFWVKIKKKLNFSNGKFDFFTSFYSSQYWTSS